MNGLQRFGAGAALCFCFVALAACGEEPVAGASSSFTSSSESTSNVEKRVERDDGANAKALRRALEMGELEDIEALFEAAAPNLGPELVVLRARHSALLGKELEVTQRIEEARALAPKDPRVYATAGELHASAGRFETARDELRRGLEACGMSPELLRAQGALELCQQGGAKRGLELVERALKYDAELPFTARLLGQAHLLLGKRALSERRTNAALEHARTSLQNDPGDIDAQLFFADTLAASGEFPSAVRVLEELESKGFGRGAELALMYKRAAVGELLLKQRDRALEYFRLARAAGLDDEQLGSGVEILREASEEAMRQGVTAFKGGDLETAELRFEHALRFDDSMLVVHSQLAVVYFQQQKFLQAATHWRRVLDDSAADGLEPPDPVHIYLAKALYAADQKSDAKKVLETYLEGGKTAPWYAPTLDLLEELQ